MHDIQNICVNVIFSGGRGVLPALPPPPPPLTLITPPTTAVQSTINFALVGAKYKCLAHDI